MKFGICTSVEDSPVARAAGWDFVEVIVQNLLQGLIPDDQWQGMQRMANCALPALAANMLVPAALKVTGPDADLAKLQSYMATIARRAQQAGIKLLVFGSAGARNVPVGWDRLAAARQLTDFLRMAAQTVAKYDLTLVIEPLYQTESNIVNSVPEAVQYVAQVNHPNLGCLVDSFHFWMENENLSDLRAAMPWIKHVHVADKDGRVLPGLSGSSDYRPLFRVLKEAKYTGMISAEVLNLDIRAWDIAQVLEYLRKEWEAA